MKPVYFDASIIVSLFLDDAFAARAEAFLRIELPVPLVSDFAAAEFASALGVRVRMDTISADAARRAFADFDSWRVSTWRIETTTADVALAEAWLRRLDLGLRTPDALNIALARRAGGILATFDLRMAEAAKRLDMQVAAA
jgi:predicted nucleic acid-binding protein